MVPRAQLKRRPVQPHRAAATSPCAADAKSINCPVEGTSIFVELVSFCIFETLKKKLRDNTTLSDTANQQQEMKKLSLFVYTWKIRVLLYKQY